MVRSWRARRRAVAAAMARAKQDLRVRIPSRGRLSRLVGLTVSVIEGVQVLCDSSSQASSAITYCRGVNACMYTPKPLSPQLTYMLSHTHTADAVCMSKTHNYRR